MSQETKLQAIRDFAANGYCLIPLRGKIPIPTKWTDIAPGTYGEKELAGQNYGVALRAGDVVVDVDPRNFEPGDHPLQRLVADAGATFNSFVVRTGGGGLHIYFRKPPDINIVGGLKAYPGVEFKSVGRQVVGPGSIHPDSKQEYIIKSGGVGTVAQAPSGLLALIKKTNVPYSDIDGGTKAYKNDEATQQRYVSYLTESAEPSIEGKRGDDNAFQVACAGRDLALPPQITWELMLAHWNPRCSPPWEDEELKAKVINAYKFATKPVGASHASADFDALPVEKSDTPNTPAKNQKMAWDTDRNGNLKPKSFFNLLTYLRYEKTGLNGIFGHNEFTGEVVFIAPAPWHKGKLPKYPAVTDRDLKQLKGHLTLRHSYEMPVTNIEEAVSITADRRGFHPVREYLTNLEWDGKPRIDTWLRDYLGVKDGAYTRACARKTLCAAVMRVMCPGCKFDHVLILEGGQDIGKSSICRILGGEFSADFTVDPHNKDTVQLMQGKWILELAEFERPRKADNEALKAFITRATDKVRLPYGRLAVEMPRQSIFIATKNPGADGTYLMDETGNRRYWPVRCNPEGGQVDFAGFQAVRDQLWAEAYHVVTKKGEKIFMENTALKDAAKEAAALRLADDAWTERIAQWIHEAKPPKEFLTGRDVFTTALEGGERQFDQRDQRRIAQILYLQGWEPKIKKINGRPVRGFAPTNGHAAPADHATKLLGDLV